MDKWSPVIEHDGGSCPLQPGQFIRVFMSDGRSYEGQLASDAGLGWDWGRACCPVTLSYVMAYQVRRPQIRRKIVRRSEVPA